MKRFLAAALLAGTAWAAPANAAATFNFRYESAPEEVYLGTGDLTLADPDAAGLIRITGISGHVRSTYQGEESNRWAITGLSTSRANLLTRDLGFAPPSDGVVPGLSFEIDGGPRNVAIFPFIGGDLVIFIGEIGGEVEFSIAPSAAAVPEPAAWGMMIGGFALVGGAARYRRRTTRAAFA